MVVLFLFLLVILVSSFLGGAIYVLVEKIKTIRHLNEILEAYKEKQVRADKIVSTAQDVIYDANQKANEIIALSEQESHEMIENAERQVADLEAKQRQLCLSNANLDEKNKEIRKILSEVLEKSELCNLNFYTPHYNFEKALDYERALNNNRSEQKTLIKTGKAVIADLSDRCDKKTGTLLVKLLLRTFNSECDLLIQNVDYKNVVTFENRINNSFDQLNRLTLRYNVRITSEFLELKIGELRIYHEFQEKKQAEAEEQRQIKEIMREEIRAEREMEKAKAEAEKEEQKYQALLDKMMEAARQAQGVELEKMNAQIAVLQQQLDEAKEKERAISQAQLTKAGYVYVISNVGSFGENVFKIGMTRRLEPQERVDELGDASVPFQFDVHAMIYHENAPELENKLHQIFERNRVNKINPRKEFFKVSLDEIEQAARQYKADVSFTKIAEAKEYRQSLAIEKEMAQTA